MNAPQGSTAWLSARAGHATASRFKDVLARIKVGEAAGRRNYRMQLVTERLTCIPCESYTNAAMQWGTDTEPAARAAYEALTGEIVAEAPFLLHTWLDWVGASPDGLVGADGGIEIKCPHQSTVHVETLQGGMPPDHIAQIQGVMWVTGRQWVDFVSFDPRMPENLQLHVERIKRDEPYITLLETEVRKFLAEVDALEQQLRKRVA